MIYLLDADTLIFMIRGLKSSNRHQASRERARKQVDRLTAYNNRAIATQEVIDGRILTEILLNTVGENSNLNGLNIGQAN